MSKIEVPEGMDDERAEQILEQRAKARSGKKKSKRSTRNKAGVDDSDGVVLLMGLLALLAWGLAEFAGISLS
jgi:hypothetical protein